MFNLMFHTEFILTFFIQDIKDLNKYILCILKKMTKNPTIRKTKTWTESKAQMVSILTRKIQKLKVDHHFRNVDVNDIKIHTWVSWFLPYHFNKTSFKTNLTNYVFHCQEDRNKICNQVSVHLFGLLLLLIFSLGLVMCLFLPSTNIVNEEMAVVKAIPNSPGIFLI